MKKLEQYKDEYQFFTGKTSDIIRGLAFAGIAVIWIFKYTDSGQIKIPDLLITPLILLVFGLILDLFQYIAGGIIWFAFFRFKECQIQKGSISEKESIDAPNILPLIIHLFYFSKIIVIIIAYILLIKFLYCKLQ